MGRVRSQVPLAWDSGLGNNEDHADPVSLHPGVTMADDASSSRDEPRLHPSLFEALVDSSYVGHVIANSEGVVLYVNPYFAGLHGYTPDEMIGRPISLVHTPEQLTVSRDIIAAAVKDGVTRPQEHRYLHRDGTEFALLVSCAALPPRTGSGQTFALTAVDPEESHRARVAYQTLFNEMLDGFAHHAIICDESGAPVDYRFLAVNPAFEKMTGLRADEIVGHTVREVLPGTEQSWIDTYGRVALTGEPVRFENYAQSLDKHFEVTAFRPAPGEFATIFQDITAKTRSAESLRQSKQALLKTQRAVRLGSWTLDLASDEVTWSEELYALFDLDPTTPVPSLTEQGSLFSPESFARLTAAVADTAQTGVPYDLELEIVKADGTHGWCWAHGERIADGSGKPTGLWGTAQDITDRKRQEEERASLEAELARARRLESVGRLAGGVAHDFNNMLTVILGHAERNIDRVTRESPLYADLQEIREVAERSADLTRQLLAFARSQPTSPSLVDLNAKVADILQLLRRLIGENIRLTWMPGENLSPIRIDPSQVDQILTNLCVNARDAIGGSGEITVETSTASFDDEFCVDHPDVRPGDYVELSVTDNGSGMSSDTVEHLFEPFYTTKELGRGTGLGLATVYGIVEQNGGFVTADSAPGAGTTFRIFFPRQEEAASEPVPQRASRRSDVGGQETILLVEDEPGILAMTTKTLASRGYTVLAASIPSEALRMAEAHTGPIHLIATDITLPEMNGRALADELAATRPDAKRLFMSGNFAATASEDDDAPFIAKPFSLGDFAAKVREILDS